MKQPGGGCNPTAGLNSICKWYRKNMSSLALENLMTEETGQGIHNEINDLRQQFEEFRKWIIGGALAMTFSLIGQAAIVAWNASSVTTQVEHNRITISEAKILSERINEEQIRRASQLNSIGEIRADIRADISSMRQLMQEVRDDVVRLKAKGNP